MTSAPADATLLAQARLGRTDAFEALVLRHQGLVCAITFSMLGDRSLSEDIAQETFIAAWRARDEVREPDRFRGWLCTTARNLALKARRRLGRTAELPDRELADDHVGPEDGLAARESEAMVWRALEAVPAAYREPLVLYYREGRSAAQVAEQLGLTVAAVEQRLSRGRRYLKEEVEDLVERTLERSRPSAGFAAGVMAALPKGPAAASEPANETMTTDAARSGSTTTMMTIAKALALAGAVSGLGIAAHAAITTEERVAGSAHDDSGSEHASAPEPSGSARDDGRAGHDRTLVAGSDREGSDVARAGDEPAATAEAALAPGSLDYVITRLSPTQVAVELAGGPSTARSGSAMLGMPEAEAPTPVRTIRGRVLDQAGQPVANAVVVAGKRLGAMLSTSLTAQVGTTTASDGTFALETWQTEPLIMLAMHRAGGWSPVAPIAEGSVDLAVDLRLGPTATLEGTITRGGAPLEAEVMVGLPGSNFRMRVVTDAQGRYRMDRLPAGELEVSTWMSHDAGFGSGSRASSTVSLAGGTTRRLDLDLPIGSHVTVEAEVPEGAQMMQYVLLMGEHAVPDAATLARLRRELPAGQTRQLLYGGIDLDEVMQWSDVPAGKVTFCVEAMATKDELVGMACTVSEVKDASEGVHEVRLVIAGE